MFIIFVCLIVCYSVYLLGVALGCRASAIIYQNTRVLGAAKCHLYCIHDPQSKYSAFIEEEFWIMSHYECRLNWHFWRSKKVVQVVQIGGRGS